MLSSSAHLALDGDWLWEHKSTLHCVLMISGAGYQGELEPSGETETPATCEGQALSVGPGETQNRGGSLKDFPAVERESEGQGLDGAPTTGEREGG